MHSVIIGYYNRSFAYHFYSNGRKSRHTVKAGCAETHVFGFRVTFYLFVVTVRVTFWVSEIFRVISNLFIFITFFLTFNFFSYLYFSCFLFLSCLIVVIELWIFMFWPFLISLINFNNFSETWHNNQNQLSCLFVFLSYVENIWGKWHDLGRVSEK